MEETWASKIGVRGYCKLSLATLQIDDEMIGWDLCMGPNLSARSTSLLMGQREDEVRCPLEACLINPGRSNPKKGWQRKGLVATYCNDGGKRALWMLAKRSKMSKRSQCQDEGEQRPGDERRANNSGGFLRDQQSTANPNHVFG